MDAQRFLEEFGYIASAPGGIQRLREMIYNLAITGDLTQQRPEDGDAQTLLEKIELTRQRLIQSKAYRRLPKLESEPLNIPSHINLPASWRWTRLLDVGEISPRNDASDDEPAAFIPMSGIPQLHKGKLVAESRTWGEIKKGFTHFANGDVVLAKITPCFENGKAAVITGLDNPKGIGAGTTELHVFRPIDPEVLSEYVYIFLRSPYFAVEGERNMTGTAGQKRLSTEYFATRAMPLPPFAEQKRIVAKVDELMALCAKLEELQQQRRILQNALRQSTLQAVAAATSPHELQSTWSRLAANFGQLFHAPENVVELRGLILDLAVSGTLLSPSMKTESSGAALLDKIAKARLEWSKSCDGQEQKEALSMIRKLRTQKITVPKTVLPDHWVWATLLQIAQVIVDCDHKTPRYAETGVHLIRTTDIRNGQMLLGNTRKVSEESFMQRSRRLSPVPGDIFFTREAPMGEAAVVPENERVCLGQRLMLIRLFNEYFNNQFLLYVIQSPGFQRRMQVAAVGLTVKHINVSSLEELVIPVPPKAEQDRIVLMVDSLFKLCNEVEAQLNRKVTISTNLAKFATATVTGITVEQEEDEPMHPPQTKLIAPLRLGQTPDIKAQAPLATILARHNGEMNAKDLWQRFGGEIDAFYAQLKLEVSKGWIREPVVAEMRVVEAD